MTEERENKPLPDEEIPQADSAQNAPAPEQALPVLLPAPAEESAPDVPSTPESAQEEPESRPILEQIDINELRRRPLNDLQEMAETLPIRNSSSLTKSQLVFELGRQLLAKGHEVVVSGVMEQAKDNYAMLRDPVKSFRTSPDDIYLGGNLIKPLHLRVGQLIKVRLRKLRPHDKYLSASAVISVEGIPAEEYRASQDFERLTPLFPKERLLLENKEVNSAAMRVLDLMTPFGKGQRGLIVAPPRGGKTVLLKTIARSIRANYPQVELIVLLLDERPEEVTDFEETVDAPVYASTFDEPSRRHAQVSDLVIERAKRLVEMGRDVVILLDSLNPPGTRLQCQSNGRPHHVRRPRLQCPGKTPQILFRRAQCGGRRQPDHHRYLPGGHGIQDGRSDLRGVQGYGQSGNPPGQGTFRTAHLSGHFPFPKRHPQ